MYIYIYEVKTFGCLQINLMVPSNKCCLLLTSQLILPCCAWDCAMLAMLSLCLAARVVPYPAHGNGWNPRPPWQCLPWRVNSSLALTPSSARGWLKMVWVCLGEVNPIWHIWDECGSSAKTPQSQRLWCVGNPRRSHKHLDVICTCKCTWEWIDHILGSCWLASGRDKTFRRSKLSMFLHAFPEDSRPYISLDTWSVRKSGITWINS